MPDLRQQLSECLKGSVCLVGLGNPDRGDDGFGVRLAEAVRDRWGGEEATGLASRQGSTSALTGDADRLAVSGGSLSLQAEVASFPLTPALSLRERVNPRPPPGRFDPPGPAVSRGAFLPLPKGEGRGEGEGDLGTQGRAAWAAGSSARSPCGGALSRLAVLVAGCNLEKHVGALAGGGFDHVLFLDAVEFGGVPGSVVLLDSARISSRFPQTGTHRISLGLLARVVESGGSTRAWLLGVQPASLDCGDQLSEPVRSTLEVLTEWLGESLEERLALTLSLSPRRGNSPPSLVETEALC